MTRFLVLLLLYLCSLSAHAEIVVQARKCENCTEAQRQATATPGGPGERYVYSFNQNIIKRYMVEWYTEDRGADDDAQKPEGDTDGYWLVYEIPLDPDAQAVFNQVRGWRQQTGFVFHEHIVWDDLNPNSSGFVRGGDPVPWVTVGSAYDALSQPSLMRDIGIAVRIYVQPTILGQVLSDKFNINFNVGKFISFGLSSEIKSVMRIDFSDGSEFTMKYDPNIPDRYVYMQGTAYDAEDQQIVDDSLVQGCLLCGQEFFWTDPANATRWRQRTSSFGVNVHVGNRLVCGRVNGGPLQCTPAP